MMNLATAIGLLMVGALFGVLVMCLMIMAGSIGKDQDDGGV